MATPTIRPGHDTPGGDPMTYYEPQAQVGHWTALINGKLYTYGGYYPGASREPPSVVELFDVATELWVQSPTSGSPPPGFHGAACAVIGQRIYHFAGTDREDSFNGIHELDSRKLTWTELTPMNPEDAPIPKFGAGMVSYGESVLVTFAGYGVLPENPRTGIDIPDTDGSNEGWTNELVIFDISSRRWSSPETTGSRPPPCARCSFTRVDYHRTIAFGGEQLEKCVPNHIYILDMQFWAWTRVSSAGPGQPWPVARFVHSAVSLHDPDNPDSTVSDPALMVWWGTSDRKEVLNDSWSFHVNTHQWRKVMLPDSLKGRAVHTTTIVHRDSTHKRLVNFGGVYDLPEDDDADLAVLVADTTVVELDSTGPSGDWVVTDVITTSQLGQPREKKDSLPRHVQLNIAEEMRHLTVCDRVIREKGKLDLTALQGMMNGPPRVGKSTLLKQLIGKQLALTQTDVPQPVSPESAITTTAEATASISTGVAERVLQVAVKKSTRVIASVPQPGMIWEVLAFDEEAIALLKSIVRANPAQMPDSGSLPLDAGALESSKATPTPGPSSTSQSMEDRAPLASGQGKRLHSLFRFGRLRGQPASSSSALPGFKPPLDIFKDALRSKKWSTVQAILEGSLTLYFTDVGGQPEFQELLPALIAGPSVFFVVFKLTDDLNQKYRVQYVQSATRKTRPYESTFTVKEMILQSLASISSTCSYISSTSKEAVLVKPRVVLVGTYKDVASKAQIAAIQRELKDTFQDTQYYRDGTLVYAAKDEPVVTVDNLSPDSGDPQKVREMVERIARHPSFRISIPTPWLLLSLALKLLGSDHQVISYEQCLSIANECGIETEEELNEALWFLHIKLGVLRHFRSIPELKDIVIRDPQVIFDKITELMSRSFTFETTDQFVEDQFQQKGIFPARVIEELTTMSSELLTPDKLVKLLEHLHIIAPIQNEKEEVEEYFMPCVLSHADPSPPATTDDGFSIPFLLVTFRCGYCPKGVHSALTVHMLSSQKDSSFTWKFRKDGVSRNRVTFNVGREYHEVAIMTHGIYLEISIRPGSESSRKQQETAPHEICDSVRQCIEQSITAVSQTLHYTCDSSFHFGFYCTALSCRGREKHPAVCHHEDPLVMECSKTGDAEDLSGSHRFWFGHPDIQSVTPQREKPEMHHLTTLYKVVPTVEAKWDELAYSLGFEYPAVQSIQRNHRQAVKMACIDVLGKWLSGEGGREPRNWATLLEALEKIGNSELAETIRNKLCATKK